jgi:DNA-binding FadR family transcriptional regulator
VFVERVKGQITLGSLKARDKLPREILLQEIIGERRFALRDGLVSLNIPGINNCLL